MKRILAILILIFITSLYTATVFSSMRREGNAEIIEKIKEAPKKKSIAEKEAAPADTTPKKIKELGPSLPKTKKDSLHRATWYKTEGTRVHREHPTAAYNFAPKGTKLLVINTENQKSCIVEVTDRMGKKSQNHIDLSHLAFGFLADHSIGRIKVLVKILEQ